MAAQLALAVLAGSATAVEPPAEALIPRVQAKEFDVHFQTTDVASIVSVELWYTLDHGTSWKRFELDPPQRHSPLRYVAPQEGMYGLFVIVKNQAGASSGPPQPGTPPQQWCFVDWTPPLVQLHVAEKDDAFETTRRIALKWTAYDRHLLSRPIDMYYMASGQRVWVPIELHLPNSGRYDWRVPDQVGGEVLLKLAVSDRVGHVVERFSERLRFEAAMVAPTTQRVVAEPPLPPKLLANQPLDTTGPGIVSGRQDAERQVLPTTREARAAAPAREVTTTTPTRAATATRPRPTREPPPVRRPPPRRPKSGVMAGVESSARSGRIPPKRQAAPRRRASASAYRSGVLDQPTTVAAALVGPVPPALAARAGAPRDNHSPPVDAARALRLYGAGTYYRLRGQHGQRGDLAIAALRFQEALRANPTFADARLDLAGVLFLQGQYGEAAKTYQTLLAGSPDHRGALRGLALTMVHARKYKSAKDRLMHLVGLNPNDGEAWLNLGDVCHKMGELQTARDYWSEAAGASPGLDDVAKRARKRLATYAPLPLVPR